MKYKGVEIGIPTIENIKEYIKAKNFNISADEVYNHYKGKNWLTLKNKPICTLEAMVNAWNGAFLHKERKKIIREKRKASRIPKKKKIKKQKEPYVYIPYKEQLNDKRWSEFREHVFKHRGRKCEVCGSTKFLQIHHLRYKKKHYAWEYKVKDMRVLCKTCHEKTHCVDLDREFIQITN